MISSVKSPILVFNFIGNNKGKWIKLLSEIAFLPPTSHIQPELTKKCLKLLTDNKEHYY